MSREDELNREIQSHLDAEAEETGDVHAARRAFGNPTLAMENTRDVWAWAGLDRLRQDCRYAVRTLARMPGFSAVIVLTLALGIGANTAIFSIVNSVLLHPLPYPNSDRLVMVWETDSKPASEVNAVANANFKDWVAQNDSFQSLAAFLHRNFTLGGGDRAERVAGEQVSPSLFTVLGVAPLLGRGFLPEDELQVPYGVVVLSNGLWRRRFGADPGVIGRQIPVEGRMRTVVGVMPPGFNFPAGLIRTPPEIWTPLSLPPKQWAIREFHFLRVVGRLRDQVPLVSAQAEMSALQHRIMERTSKDGTAPAVKLIPLLEDMVGDVKGPLYILFGAVLVVLLIACVNIANLMLARGSARQREFAIRFALGASRGRIVRQVCTESLLLSAVGGGLGTILALWLTSALVAMAPAEVPRLDSIHVDLTVLAFTLGLSVFAGLLSGLVPALAVSTLKTNEQLKAASRGSTDESSRKRLRGALVICEISLAIVLVAGAGLLIQSLYRLEQVNPGFGTNNVLTFFVSEPDAKYNSPAKQVAFFDQLIQRVGVLPGVSSAGGTTSLPLSGSNTVYSFDLEGRPSPPGEFVGANYRAVSPDYFQTMGIPLQRGRGFTARDNSASPPVVIINEALAHQYFPNRDQIGQHLRIGDDRHAGMSEIVGVVGDVRHRSLDRQPRPEMYEPYAQTPGPYLTIAVRTSIDPRAVLGAIQREVAALDADVPISKVLTMHDWLADSLSSSRFRTTLLAAFAGFALVLAALGIYGVMAYMVSRRTSEIGVRLALGARPAQVLRLVIGQACKLSVAGVVIGCAAALALTRFLKGLLFGIAVTDPVTFAGAAAVLMAIAILASYIPARRAARVDPVRALRNE